MTLAEQKRLVETWNAEHRPGAAVIVTLDDGAEIQTQTRSEAQLLSGHTAVVWLKGFDACYLLSRVRPEVL